VEGSPLESSPASVQREPGRRVLDTPRRAPKKDILLDMAMRAQPVLVEVEARKRWSVQNTSAARGSVDSPDNVGTGGMSQGGGTS
jgi:hypothetical protein